MASVETSGLTPLQNAVYLVKQAQSRLAALEYAQSEPIAIVGLGCRFPGGANGAEAFWQLLSHGIDAVREVPPQRWNIDEFYDPDPTAPGKVNTRRGGFLDRVDEFDADFFGISPREAIRVDPQHRVLLEVGWEALEDAGIVPGDIAQTKAGVYIGVIGNDYALLQSRDLLDVDVFSGTGCSHAILSNRLSYVLNLNGPSITLDTACSSSLVTVHLACQSLRRREIDLALAGGVNLMLTPEMTVTLTKAYMMSPDGRCNTFDASANGYVRGEGCGLVVLKRLSDAMAVGDRILALVRGSAVNHDGRSNGLSAPNGPAQEAVIRAALREAGLQPRQISYIEAHGTGTRLGDPIEIEALREVFAADRTADSPLLVGSVKTNIGHLESAAGIAGLAKIIVALQHEQIPPHLNLRTVNPLLKLDETPLEIPTALHPWPQDVEPRRAGVSSFGFGGTNGHVILEEAPKEAAGSRQRAAGSSEVAGLEAHYLTTSLPHYPDRSHHLLTLSARTPQALTELATRYATYLDDSPTSLADIAHTAAVGRTHFNHRLAIPAASPSQAASALERFIADATTSDVCYGQVIGEQSPRIAFLFTGQGAQYAGMGLRLYETQPVFRDAIDRCASLLDAHLDRPLLSLLQAESRGQKAEGEQDTLPTACRLPPSNVLDKTGYTQPVMFALEYALATLWMDWGIKPAAVLGHSVGEFAAACIAGVFSLEDGIRLIAERARLMQSLPAGGCMAAVFAAEPQVTAAIRALGRGQYAEGCGQTAEVEHANLPTAYCLPPASVSIAALNGPESIVISGDSATVAEVLGYLAQQGIKSKPLATSHAFHSQRMEPILDALRQAAAKIVCSKPQFDIISNLTGKLADEHTFADPCYWSRHARSPVRFSDGIKVLADRGYNLFLEIGPSPTLIGLGRRCLTEADYAWLPSLRPGRDDWQSMLESLGQLYVHGAKLDWAAFDRPYRRHKTSLPTYPFQRKRYWTGSASTFVVPPLDGVTHNNRLKAELRTLHPLLGRRLVAAVREQVYESQLSAHRPATLADHKIQGKVVMPGAAFLEMALAAGDAMYGEAASGKVGSGKQFCVRDFSLVEPLLLDKTPKTIQTIVSPEGRQAASVRIVHVNVNDDANASEPEFVTHALGRIEVQASAPNEIVDLAAIRARFTGDARDVAWRKDALRKSGIEPGPTFSWLVLHWTDTNEALGQLRPPCDNDRAGDYQIHPGLLDGALQLIGAILPGAGTGIDAYIPMSFERLQRFAVPQGPLWALATLLSFDGKVAVGNVDFIDEKGLVILKIEGATLRSVSRDWIARLAAGPLPDWCYRLAWDPQPIGAIDINNTSNESAKWLIFDSTQGLGTAIADRLRMKSHECTIVAAASSDDALRLSVEEFLNAQGRSSRGIVFLSDVHSDSIDATPDFADARQHGWGAILELVQALTSSGKAKPPELWLVTRGAIAATNANKEPLPLALEHSPTWGLGRVIASEHPELKCVRIDLDPVAGNVGSTQQTKSDLPSLPTAYCLLPTNSPFDHDADQLAEELCYGQHEDQVAYRGSQRLVARLRRLDAADPGTLQVPRGEPYRLEITSRGQLDNVVLRPTERHAIEPGQIEIRVRATGLNFRDVLNVLNLYPGDPGPLGGECSGEVVAIGTGVSHLSVGDAVIALAPASFASHVTTLAEFAAPKPEHLSFEEAATIPICFLSVEHALKRLGHIRRGERVLIHAASGGVGLAAIQIAKNAGAEIFATAGSPHKRDYLRSLGIEHVMDSRSLAFADQIREATGGQGIDLVLNSLTGETIAASLSLLRPGGRFLELGKTDLWDQARVDTVHPGVTFHAIALDHMMADEPETVGQLLRAVLPQFTDKTLAPLPLRTFPMARVVDGLRHMARAEHIGKVVIQAAPESKPAQQSLTLREDGTYLITGGLGGLGLKLTQWLVDRGARHLVLLSRSGLSDDARVKIDALSRPGVTIDVRTCDVGNDGDLACAINQIDERHPLRGVFHLAGVLDDGILREQSRERFDRVMSAKVHGAWCLHELTRDKPLDLFVLFSSAASIMGSPGQGNYAAANAFLDGLAHHRRSLGLPGLSVNWGSWDEVGMAARLKETEGQRWSASGIGWIGVDQGLATMERLILDNEVQAAVLPIDWSKFFERVPADSVPPWLKEMARDTAPVVDAGPPELLEKLNAATLGERLDLTVNSLRQQAARVLAMDDDHLPDPRRTLNELGFDSLTAVEFCNRVSRSIGQRLNPTVLFDHPTLEALSGYVLRDLLDLATEAGSGQRAEGSDTTLATEAFEESVAALDEVEMMSEEEMDALVTSQLTRNGV
jgi:acyl transferase domain-containing protein